MRLLPREVLPEAERRAWSRRHPVRTSIGHALLVTPLLAVVVVLVPGISWPARVVGILAVGVAAFVGAWCVVRFRPTERDAPPADRVTTS